MSVASDTQIWEASGTTAGDTHLVVDASNHPASVY
jgi:hypothetical protein